MFALLTGLLLGFVLWRERRKGRIRVWRTLSGAAWLFLLAVGVAVGVGVLWRLLTKALWTNAGPGAAAAMGWLLAVVAVTAATTAPPQRRLTARLGEASAHWAAIVLWWALAMAVSLALPGAGYVFVWPALAAIAAWPCRAAKWWMRLAAFTLVAATTVLLVVPLLDTFFQMAQPRPGNPDSQMPEVMAAVALLVSLVTLLLAAQWQALREDQPPA